MKTFFPTVFFIFSFFQITIAQDSLEVVKKKIYVTKPLQSNTPPIIDGLLDDPAWNVVQWETGFTEQRPDENTAPSHHTKFKIAYDQKFLYVGVRCLDDA